MIVLLNRSEILKNSPYPINDPDSLFTSLDKVYNRSEELNILASILLYTLAKEKFSENNVGFSLCVVDAFLRKNKKKISLGYITEPTINKSQQIVKIITFVSDISHAKVSIGDVMNWLLWHTIESNKSENIWDFCKDEKDLISFLDRSPQNATR